MGYTPSPNSRVAVQLEHEQINITPPYLDLENKRRTSSQNNVLVFGVRLIG